MLFCYLFSVPFACRFRLLFGLHFSILLSPFPLRFPILIREKKKKNWRDLHKMSGNL